MGGKELVSKGGMALDLIPKVILGRKSQISKAKTLAEIEFKTRKHETIKRALRAGIAQPRVP